MRRWFAQAVMLAFVLPAIIGLLPQPALSASTALDQDILMSVCGQDLPGQPDGGQQHQATHDHCMLCGNHGQSCCPTLGASAPAFAATPRHVGIPQTATPEALASPLQALLDASPPRGPPASV
ncbi:MAG: hypothetical protein WCJ41_14530 [Aestuariivirga sp.]|uniref:hypothetical protein n=1 Tax=Aestuariivirga sp. TaxID=2650926 RepID=UPI0030182BE5